MNQEDPSFRRIGTHFYNLRGIDGLEMINCVDDFLRQGSYYDTSSGQIIGSSPFLVLGITPFVEMEGFTPLTLSDLSLKEIRRLIGRYYLNPNGLVVRSNKKNNPHVKTLCEIVEQLEGSVKFPFLVEGIHADISADGEIELTPGDNFRYIQDERFSKGYSGEKFDFVDSFGMPLFNREGKSIWITSNDELSGISLSGDMIDTGDYDLFTSLSSGRLIFKRNLSYRDVALLGEFDEKGFEVFKNIDFSRDCGDNLGVEYWTGKIREVLD